MYQRFVNHHAEMGLNAPFRLSASLDMNSFITQPQNTALFVLSSHLFLGPSSSFDTGTWQTWNSVGRMAKSRSRCPQTWLCLSSTSSATDSGLSRPALAQATTPGSWPTSSSTEPLATTSSRWESYFLANCIVSFFSDAFWLFWIATVGLDRK